jgi:hypothetical protein
VSYFRVVIAALTICAASSAESCVNVSGNDRLYTYCLLNQASDKVLTARDVVFLSTQLESVGQDRLINVTKGKSEHSFAAFPLVQYSDNINGGNPDKPLVLGALTFTGDPELYRKQGVVAGLGTGLSGRYHYSESGYLTYRGNASYVYSPQHEIGIGTTSAELCSINHIGDWWYVDACANKSGTNRELGNSESSNGSVMLSKLFEGDSSYNQVSVTYNRYFASNYDQNQYRLGWDRVHQNGVYTSLTATYGQPVTDELTTRYSLNATIKATVEGKPLSVSFGYSDARGGKLLGIDRDDKSYSVNFSYPINDKISLTAGFSQTISSIDYFDNLTPNIGLQMAAYEF